MVADGVCRSYARRYACMSLIAMIVLAVAPLGCGTTTDPADAATDSAADGADQNGPDGIDDPDAPADAAPIGDAVVADTIGLIDADATSASTDAASADVAIAPDAGVDAKPGDTGPKPVDDFKELLVKILTPTGHDWAQNEGEKIQLAGVAFGNADSVTWSAFDGKNTTTGGTSGGTYWTSSIISLLPGDNSITVTATKGTQTATDSIHIVYNPLFSFDGPPDISPDVLFVNENAKSPWNGCASTSAARPSRQAGWKPLMTITSEFT